MREFPVITAMLDDEQKRSYQAVVFGLESRETHDEKLSYNRSCGFVYL